MAAFVTYRRWRLRPGVELADVVDLVRDRIEPHYRVLDPDVRLGLELIDGSRSVLAVQQWPDRDRFTAATTSAGYPAWLAAYRPALLRWDELLEFETDWTATRLL